VQGAQRLIIGIHRFEHFLLIDRRIKRLAAHLASDQIHGNHIIPLPDQKVLKLNGLMRTNSPALTASGAFGHIVPKRSPIFLIVIA
jgi:hypothetical protein